MLGKEGISDAIFCKALNDSVASVHQSIVASGDLRSGSTMCSLFLIPCDIEIVPRMPGIAFQGHEGLQGADRTAAEAGINPESCGRSYRVLCANIGDSRCAMFGMEAEKEREREREGTSMMGGGGLSERKGDAPRSASTADGTSSRGAHSTAIHSTF